jgi:phosphatidylglycerophosphate synthase
MGRSGQGVGQRRRNDTGAVDRPDWEEYTARWLALHGGTPHGVAPRGGPGPGTAAPPRWHVAAIAWRRFTFDVAQILIRLGVRPNTVTAAGLICSLAVPVVVSVPPRFHPSGGWLFLGAGLVFLAALADSADGAVAILTGRTSASGSFFDAVADRISEAAWLVALWLVGAPGPLVVACGALVALHEYVRVRAALAGLPASRGVSVADRPTRVCSVLTALVLGGAFWDVSSRLAAGAVTVTVALWLIFGLLGAGRLLGAARAFLR